MSLRKRDKICAGLRKEEVTPLTGVKAREETPKRRRFGRLGRHMQMTLTLLRPSTHPRPACSAGEVPVLQDARGPRQLG